MTLDTIRNFRALSSSLATGGQPTEDHLREVAAAGFRVVVNLALHDDPRYSLPDEPGTVTRLGMRYVHIPVQFRAPRHEDFVAFADVMDELGDTPVFVHCAANYRVTAFVGLYRVLRLGWTDAEAFAPMRGIFEPDPVWARFLADELARRER